MFTYFSWWYYEEPIYLWRSITIITKKIYASFSVTNLLSTLFDPWKKDVSYAENASLDERFKIFINNLFSRFIGFIVRLITIVIGLVFSTVVFVVLSILFLIWLLMPVVILYLLFNGFRTVFYG